MKKKISLKEVITSLLNSDLKYDLGHTHQIDLKTATPKQKYDFWNNNKKIEHYSAISIKNGNLYCYYVFSHLCRKGTKYYIKREIDAYFSIVGGKVRFGKTHFTGEVLHRFGLATWLPEDYIIKNGTILKAILTSEVYSEESLYKFIAKRIIREDIPWKLLKEYQERHIDMSIYDLKDITNNVQEAMRVFLEVDKLCHTDSYLYYDVYRSAIMLGEKVNPKWSMNRLREEHKRQIRELTLADIESKDDTNLYAGYAYPYNEHIALLRTEREVFMEASEMHHCLHSNYWNDIQNYRYMAFSVSYNGERATMGVSIDKYDGLFIDQIRSYYNNNVSPELTNMCQIYIQEFGHILFDLIERKSKRFTQRESQYDDFNWDDFETAYEAM